MINSLLESWDSLNDFKVFESMTIPVVDLYVEAEIISNKSRKLKAKWSYEADQDFKSVHGIGFLSNM